MCILTHPNQLFGQDTSAANQSASALDADGFDDFFSKNVCDIRALTDGQCQPRPNIAAADVPSMGVFHPVTEAEVRQAIIESPLKSSSLGLIPTFLLKEVLVISCHTSLH